MSKKLTTEEFIEKAKKVHGEKYSYDKVKYHSSQSKIEIICHQHGVFEQTPNNHLNGKGCLRCGAENISTIRRSNSEDFIAKARLKHGDKFDYSFVSYSRNKDKVKIICKKHGVFEQSPNDHLSGCGCPACKAENLSVSKTSNTFDFITKATLKHGDIYDYSRVNYSRNNVKVKIICPKHEIFEQTPSDHLSGVGCPFCSGNARHTFETLSKAIAEKHNETITLLEGQTVIGVMQKYKFKHSCGYEWSAQASRVLFGQGCPACTRYGFNPEKPATFYILEISGNKHDFTGFGISNNYKQRKNQHKKNLKANNCSITSEILIESSGEVAQQLEQYVKKNLQCKNTHIEGFKTESLSIAPEELKIICEEWLTANEVSYKLSVNI